MSLRKLLTVVALGCAVATLASERVGAQSTHFASRVGPPKEMSQKEPALLERTARLTVADIPLDVALARLQAEADVPLIYSPSLTSAGHKVSCDCATVTVGVALDRLLGGTAFTYSQFERSVLIERKDEQRRGGSTRQARQARQISGRVVDSLSGAPVSVGQVGVVGTSSLVALREDGTFTVSAPSRAVTLAVRSIGYSPRNVDVPLGRDSVTITLNRDNFQLSAVVITGQASGVEKRNLANAITTVDAAELSRVPSSTIERALQGKVPGAHISANSGAPGGGSVVRMRGVTSINGAFTPMYVVDGVIVSDANLGTGTNAVIRANGTSLNPRQGNEDNGDNRIADLNVYDIENVAVLKGAAASAIYGSKAANGVIVITTKKGKAGAPQFDFNQRVGISTLERKFGHRCFSAAEAVQVFGPTASSNYTPACHDFEEELYGDAAKSYETSVSARGSIQSTQYFVSLLDNRENGIVPNTSAGKQALRINIDQPIGSRVTIALGAQGIHTTRDPGVTQNGNNGTPIGGAIAYGGATWLDLRQRADGTYPVNPYAASNAFQTVALFRNNESVWRSILSERVSVDLLTSDRQSLRFISAGGVDLFTQKNAVVSPPELFPEQFQALPGKSVLAYGQNENTNINANLVHTLEIAAGSRATSQIGIQYETQTLDASATLSQGLAGGLSNIDQGLAVNVSQNRQRVRDMGLFAQEEFLTLGERLLLTVGGRADQSSNNGDASKLYFYPKVSASYRIPWLPAFTNELKLRTALGYSGNQPLYGQKFTELLPGNIAGSIPVLSIQGSAGASDLHPERQREIEAGIDATLLQNRLNFEVTVYEKRVTDLLLQQTVAPTTGFSSLFFNGGSMRNRGLEISASAIPVQHAAFSWRTSGTYASNSCRVLNLPVPAFRPASTLNSATFGYTFIEPGKSCTQIYGRDTLGALPGDEKLGAIGTVINRKLTDANPKFNASWSNELDYNRLHLTFLIDGQKGGILGNITQYEYDVTKDSPDYLVARKSGDLSGQQRSIAFAKSSRPYLQDVSYLKLREVTIGYDVPETATRRVWSGLHTARLELSGRNLLTFTPYESTADPEAIQIARSAAQGLPWDIWSYPPSRSFFLTVRLGM
jgi:TonB-dependent starch-binding outer membrane protein SusC